MSRHLQQRISALSSVERRLEPEAAWVRATRDSLLTTVKASLPVEPVSPTRQISQFFRHFVPSQLMYVVRGPVMATLAILIAAMGGSVASVSAAERSLPGDFLYSVKLATEQARLAFTPTKEDKLKLKIEFTTRRGEELRNVAQSDVSEKSDRVVQAAEILKRDLDTVQKQLDDVNADGEAKAVVEVARLVDQTSNDLVRTLQDTKLELPAETQEKITEAQAAASDTAVKAIGVIVEKHEESNENASETEVVQALQDHTNVVANVTGDFLLTSSTHPIVVSTATTTVSLPDAVAQVKAATQNAFAAQITQEQLSNSSSTPSTSPSSTTTSATPTGSSSSTSSSVEITPP
ncbi:MAG: DUF5667 domain-containing protein [Patescibacteria group bacterium]|jgi:hypothetical protein